MRSDHAVLAHPPGADARAVTVGMPGPLLELRLDCTIAVGVLQLPTPMVRTHLLQRSRRFPTQLLLRKRRVAITGGDIPCPARPDLVPNRPAAHRLKCS